MPDMNDGSNIWIRVYRFYRDGFREMTLGRTLWALILVKLFIMFFVLRLFFFPDFWPGSRPNVRKAITLWNNY